MKTVETKFDIGDEVYVVARNKVLKSKINSVYVIMEMPEDDETHPVGEFVMSVNYGLCPYGTPTSYGENEIFYTKEELLNHLRDEY